MSKKKRSPSPEANNKKSRINSEDDSLDQLQSYFEEASQEGYEYQHLDMKLLLLTT